MDETSVLNEVRSGVLIITLNRPGKRNAATQEMARLVARAMDAFEANEALKVAVLTGAGGAFCSGMDLQGFAERGETPMVEERGFLGLTHWRGRKPLIAAVEGPAVAGGFETVLACDLVVASRSARFALPEVQRGLAAGAGGMRRLPRKIPPNVAMELVLTGDAINGERAYALGLVNWLVEPGQALTEALALAQRISANAPLSVAAGKRVVWAQREWGEADEQALQDSLVGKLELSDDAKEGALAFMEKRPARWQGR